MRLLVQDREMREMSPTPKAVVDPIKNERKSQLDFRYGCALVLVSFI